MSHAAPRVDTRSAGRSWWIGCLLIFAVALGIRLLYLGQLAATPFLDELPLLADSQYYDMRAREIASGNWTMSAPGFLSPLYCYVLGVVYKLFGPSLYGAKLFQSILGALSCVLLAMVGRRLFSSRVGLFAGLLLALYLPHIYYHGILLPPTLVVVLHLLILLLLVGRPSWWRALGGGVLIGLAVVAKANAVLLVPALAVVLLLDGREPALRKRLTAVALMVLGAVLALAPITAANHRLTGSFILVTTTGGANLMKANGPTATGSHAFLPPGAEAVGLPLHFAHAVDGRKAASQSRYLSAAARGYMLENPLRTGILFSRKLFLLLNARELGIRDQYYFAKTRMPLLRWPLLGFWAVVPLGLAGVCLAWRDWRRLGLLHCVLAVQVISFVLIFVLARYRLVMVACLMPFAAWAILNAIEWVRARSWTRFVPLVVAWAAFSAVATIPFAEFPPDRGFADQYEFLADHEFDRGNHAAAVELYEATLTSTWQDERNAVLLSWQSRIRLARAHLALGRSENARPILMRLLGEMESLAPGRPMGIKVRTRRLLAGIE